MSGVLAAQRGCVECTAAWWGCAGCAGCATAARVGIEHRVVPRQHLRAVLTKERELVRRLRQRVGAWGVLQRPGPMGRTQRGVVRVEQR